ncbi:pheromone-binding protein Gp-9 [Solenopsis invicta]|uniref:pheromone-binding protein Gp-9 n=1 Tax=Solenopsis invicta TaxID=13686 RepID=UPI0005961FEA|nr:pheromone-binding protein Gp-9 [Solenopsis invicta]
MKTFVLCACVFVLAVYFQSSSSSELNEQELRKIGISIRNDFNTCLSEIGITPADFVKPMEIVTNVHLQPANEERTNKHGCFIACVLKKQNLIEGTKIKEEQVYERLQLIFDENPGGPMHQIVQKCMEKVRNDAQECEKCFSVYVCTIKDMYEEEQRRKNERN